MLEYFFQITNYTNMDINHLATALDELEYSHKKFVPGTPSYYCSKLFISENSLNPLVACASGIITIITHLHRISYCPDPYKLQDNLIHELNDFESRAKEHGQYQHTITAARYALSAVIDEILMCKNWANPVSWDKFPLLSQMKVQNWGLDRFFILLERCCHEPQRNINLMELLYLCLSLGYQGPYRNQQNGSQQLKLMTDKLYYQIRKERGIPSNIILTDTRKSGEPKNIRFHKTPIWLAVPFAGILLTALYGGLTYHVQNSANKLQHSFKRIVT